MWKLLLLYVLGIPLGFILYFIGFKVGLFADNEIIFYRGLLILFMTSFIQWLLAIVVIIFVIKPEVSLAHALSITMTSLAVCATFLIVIPVSLDRSVSVFLLGYMKNMGHPLTRDELTFGLESIYVKKYNAIDRRIDEQLKSGNIKITENGGIALTKQGENFIALSTKIAETLDIDKKYIDPSTHH
jgi:hypothetical protein